MAAPRPPVKAAEIMQLAQLGVATEALKFRNVSIESEKNIVIRDEAASEIKIVNLATKMTTKLPNPNNAIDGAIMHPTSNVIGLRAGNKLVIRNLEMQTDMKKVAMQGNVVFWRWLNASTVAIVTETAVFHWSMSDAAEPQKMFDRSAYDGKVQVVNYRTSADGKFLILGGIAAGANGIAGVLQLYAVDMKKSQPVLDAPAACFINLTLDGRQDSSNLFCFTMRTGGSTRIMIKELGVDKDVAFTRAEEMQLPNADQDFVVNMLPDPKHGMLFMLTKSGHLMIYEIQSCKCIYTRQVTNTTYFVSGSNAETGGIVAADTTGRVVQFSIDEENLVPYVSTALQDIEMGVKLAQRFNLGGADNMFKKQFEMLMAQGQYDAAINLAVTSPQGVLRTPETIQRFQQAPVPAGGRPPLLQYFQALLGKGKLNKVESVELVRPLITGGNEAARKKIEEWVKEDKLDYSEDLGDLLRSGDMRLACSVYYRAQIPTKTIGCFLQLGEIAKIIPYAKSVRFTPDYAVLLGQLLRFNPENARLFAISLLAEDPPLIDIQTVMGTFMQMNDVANTTAVLHQYLLSRGDRDEDGPLQTKLFEINLLGAPMVARTLLAENPFTKFDRLRIARLCEQAQLFQFALENYTEIDDIRRVIVNTHAIEPEFLLNFFQNLQPADGLECMRDLLKYNLQQNINLAVELAKRYSEVLGAAHLIKLFEGFNAWTGLFYFLGALVNTTNDSDVVFKYIEACVKLDQRQECVRVCQENNYFDPKVVKDFLIKATNFKDPRALIHVCDRFNFMDELTRHLYGQGQTQVIDIYLTKINPGSTPVVVGTLLDLSADEGYICTLIGSVPAPHADPSLPQGVHCPIGPLVAQVEMRNRLPMIRPWLEARMHERNQDPELHNALAKIYIDINFNASHFLATNPYYDSKVVGKYCETRDPHLSFVAYKRANGSCDDELIHITNVHGFFKDQAKYLVERQNNDLWDQVLLESNSYRRQMIDQVIATALPESRLPEEVVCTVQAFMRANMPSELIELLDKIVLHSPKERGFHNQKNLQNLLILTAIKSDKKRVMQYVTRLDNFDGPSIAKIALEPEYSLFEEAFTMYNKFKEHASAIEVLLFHIKNMQRAADYADVVDSVPVWSILGKAQLQEGLIKESIAAFVKAQDATQWQEMIVAATNSEVFAELIVYLKMAREKVREAALDNELIVCFAKTDNLSALEDFIVKPSCMAKIEEAGDRCYELQAFQAARILYQNCNNQNKLALAWIQLKKFQEAVEAARKANTLPTWKAVCFACVDAKEFRLAAICGSNIIVVHAHLHEVVHHYEVQGFFDEVISLMEQGVNLDRAHQGIFTELGVLYSKYKEEKLMEHIKLFSSKLNIPTLLASCRENLHWKEAVFLYTKYDQFDNAVDVMVEHSSDCWTHESFKEIVVKSTSEKYYHGMEFYLNEHPLLLSELLIEMSPKLDHSRVVATIRDYGHLPLIFKYLLFVQRENVIMVNEAVNQLYIEEDNHRGLRESVDAYDQFDQLALAKTLERHDLIDFRRIAAYLYKGNKRYMQSIELSKKDQMWQDTMECAAQSKDHDLAENLLRFFVDKGLNECFSACLYTCYELVRPDVALELAWRFNLMSFAMPFMIQAMRDMNSKISALHEKLIERDLKEEKEQKEEEKAKEEAASVHAGVPMMPVMMPGMMPGMMPNPSAPLALMGPQHAMGGSMGMGGMPMGGMPMGGMPMGGMPMGGMPMGGNYGPSFGGGY